MPDLTQTSQTFSPPDNLFAGNYPVAAKTALITGAAALLRGTVLGRTHVTATDDNGAAGAGNTGTGTIGTVSADDGAQKGVWRITAMEPATDAGKFLVTRPDGTIDGTATVAVAYNGGINFTIADGGTDFIAGDFFTVTVGEGTEKYKPSLAAATDGSQVPVAILSEDVDVTSEDKEAGIYLTGDFSVAALTFGTGHTAASTKIGLEARNIYLKSTVGA
jgi:hypothetical protein